MMRGPALRTGRAALRDAGHPGRVTFWTVSGKGNSEALRFRLDAGALCLDFVATLGRRGRPVGERVDRIPTAERLGDWLRECELIGRDVPVSQGDLISAGVLREAVDGLVRGLLAGTDVAADARVVNRWASGAVATPVFDPASRKVRYESPEPVAAALTRIARDALLTAGHLDRLPVRVCAQEDCRMLFIDRSRGRPRRWCSARYCGNRAKVAAYRSRQENTI